MRVSGLGLSDFVKGNVNAAAYKDNLFNYSLIKCVATVRGRLFPVPV